MGLLAFGYLVLSLALTKSPSAATPQKLTWGNPDQSWGTRRPVTEADRAAIARYRSGHEKPLFTTGFTDPVALAAQWQMQSDDYLKSCRRPENAVATSGGLQLQTRPASNCRAQWSTGFIISRQHYGYGFFEASIKAADIDGLNNAFWLVTEDHFEIDICELHYPNIDRMTLHNNNKIDGKLPSAVGFDSRFANRFSDSSHDIGVLWTPTDIVFELDGDPIAAIRANGAIKGKADIRFSTALMDYAGKIPADPTGHHMYVKSLRVFKYQ